MGDKSGELVCSSDFENIIHRILLLNKFLFRPAGSMGKTVTEYNTYARMTYAAIADNGFDAHGLATHRR